MFIIQMYTSFSIFINVISFDGVHMLHALTTETTHIKSSILQNECPLFRTSSVKS
jgi:hypothetical protein